MKRGEWRRCKGCGGEGHLWNVRTTATLADKKARDALLNESVARLGGLPIEACPWHRKKAAA
jgi:hypothetical protein